MLLPMEISISLTNSKLSSIFITTQTLMKYKDIAGVIVKNNIKISHNKFSIINVIYFQIIF